MRTQEAKATPGSVGRGVPVTFVPANELCEDKAMPGLRRQGTPAESESKHKSRKIEAKPNQAVPQPCQCPHLQSQSGTRCEQPQAQSVSSQPRQNPHETRPHATTDVGVPVNLPCLRRAYTATPDLCERARHPQPQPQLQPRPRPPPQPQFQPQPSSRPMPQPHRCPDLQTQLCAQHEQPRAQSVSGRPRQHPHETWPHVTTVVGVIVDSPCPRQACADAIACCERRPEACIEAQRCDTCVEAQSPLECGSGVQHGEESRSIGDWSCCTHVCALDCPCCRASVVLPESIASSTVPA